MKRASAPADQTSSWKISFMRTPPEPGLLRSKFAVDLATSKCESAEPAWLPFRAANDAIETNRGGVFRLAGASSTLEQHCRLSFRQREASGVRQSALSRAATRRRCDPQHENHANFPSTTNRFFSGEAYSSAFCPAGGKGDAGFGTVTRLPSL